MKWIQEDIARWAVLYDIPWRAGWPESYPSTFTVKVQRAIIACSLEAPERFVDVVGNLFHAFWVEKKPVQHPHVFMSIIKDTLGETVSVRVEQMVSIATNLG